MRSMAKHLLLANRLQNGRFFLAHLLPKRQLSHQPTVLKQQHEVGTTAATIPLESQEIEPFTTPQILLPQKQIIGQLNYSHVGANSSTPNVYMLGWGGSVDKQLHKYSRFYEQQGYNVTRYIAPLLQAPSLAHAHPFAYEFHTNVCVQEANNRPIVFHLFSMNGCMVFTGLWELWSQSAEGEQLKKRVKGIIFDSGPADCSPARSAIALSAAAVPPSKNPVDNVLRSAAYGAFYVYFASQRIWATMQSTVIPSRFSDYFAYYRLQEIKDLPKQQLYLYSEQDCIIDHRLVTKFIKQQKQTGANVLVKKFTDTPHVSHIKKHEHDYSKLCTDFTKSLF